MDTEELRTLVLTDCGATPLQVEELLLYCRNKFDHSRISPDLKFPIPDEPFVAVWDEYLQDAREIGVFNSLKKRMPQLNFPIKKGISETAAYRGSVSRGVEVNTILEATGLELERPETLKLILHPTAAGRIPILVAGTRSDFVTMVQALVMKNEPEEIPPFTGGYAVAYNNWDRIERYRRQLERDAPGFTQEMWEASFKQMTKNKELYQDRLLLLSDGQYSGIPAEEMGLRQDEWRRLSFIIRREHESAHYFTRRVLGSMLMNCYDELLADYAGIVSASGSYRSDWFLLFMGLNSPRPSSRRIDFYRGSPPLSDGAFEILEKLVILAARNLDSIDSQTRKIPPREYIPRMLISLSRMRLEELASPDAYEIFIDRCGNEI